jgi:phosphate transport system permease protein
MLKINNSTFGLSYIILSKMIAGMIILTILSVLVIHSSDGFTQVGLGYLSQRWFPAQAEYGVLSLLYGSFMVTFLALLFAVPFGVCAAIALSEYLSTSYRLIVKSIVELMSGIPSIIYGLIGIVFVSQWVKDIFNLSFGRTLFTASILLSIMIIPTLISLCDDVFRQIPNDFRETAQGLGLTKFEVIFESLLPIAFPQIVGVVLLALGRAIGETMAIMLVIGGIDKIPVPFTNVFVPGQTITSKLGREISESSIGSLHFSVLVSLGLILMIVVLLLTFLTYKVFDIHERVHE